MLFNKKKINKIKDEIPMIFLWISLWSLITMCIESIHNKILIIFIYIIILILSLYYLIF